MTPQEIALVKKSWYAFRGIDPAVIADVFYSKLFWENPDLRRMFPARMEEQYKKIIDMLNTVVARLERMDELKEEIAAMGKRHEKYGVKPEHYTLVGKALLWTLKKGLADEWNEQTKQAWIKCYSILSGTMITATSKSVR